MLVVDFSVLHDACIASHPMNMNIYCLLIRVIPLCATALCVCVCCCCCCRQKLEALEHELKHEA